MGCVAMAADRATEARQLAERAHKAFIDAAFLDLDYLADDVLWLLDERERLTEALRQIASMPTSERNPDGDEQAAHSMQVVADAALSAVSERKPA